MRRDRGRKRPPGDIVQWYDPQGTYGTVHTAIITGGNSEGSASVIDSVYGIPLNQELVHGNVLVCSSG